MKGAYFFIRSAGVLLLITGLAKVVSGFGHAHILQINDPVFDISFRKLLLIVGIAELIIAILCLAKRGLRLPLVSVAWISTAFLIYRLAMFWAGYHKPCPCLGGLTDTLGISPQLADNFMKGTLVYLLLGSYAILIGGWLGGRGDFAAKEASVTTDC